MLFHHRELATHRRVRVGTTSTRQDVHYRRIEKTNFPGNTTRKNFGHFTGLTDIRTTPKAVKLQEQDVDREFKLGATPKMIGCQVCIEEPTDANAGTQSEKPEKVRRCATNSGAKQTKTVRFVHSG